jgi:hypothetical protein
MPRMIAAASPRCSGVITPALDEPVESRVRKLRGIAALDHRPRLGAIFRREQSASDGILNDRLWDGHSEQSRPFLSRSRWRRTLDVLVLTGEGQSTVMASHCMLLASTG